MEYLDTSVFDGRRKVMMGGVTFQLVHNLEFHYEIPIDEDYISVIDHQKFHEEHVKIEMGLALLSFSDKDLTGLVLGSKTVEEHGRSIFYGRPIKRINKYLYLYKAVYE